MKTHVTKKSDIERKWYIINAKGVILGKLAVKVADLLRGKNKVNFSPSVDCGDHVIIINASKIAVTGGKEEKKKYYRHSRYPGGLKTLTLSQMMVKDSRKVIELAVKGMLPKNKLANKMIKKMRVFKDEKHNYEAQQPEVINI